MAKKRPEPTEPLTEGKDMPSQAETPKTSGLLEFTLPPVSDTATDFIGDIEAEPAPAEQDYGDLPPDDTAAPTGSGEDHRGTPDSKGNPYDPAKHAYPPELTGKLQKWKKLSKNAKPQSSDDSEVKPNASYRREAAKLASLYAQSHIALFGNEGRLLSQNDIMPLTDDLERYMMENGHTEISAGWAVAMSAGLYSVEVCQREKNIDKVKRFYSTISWAVKGWFGIKKPAKVKKAPEPEKATEPTPDQKAAEKYKEGF